MGRVKRVATLARWRLRVGRLWLQRQTFRSIEGWGLLIVLLVAAPSIWELARRGTALVEAATDESLRIGALLTAQLALSPAFVVVVVALFTRDFVARRDEEPLLAHPSVLSDLTFVRVLGAISWGAVHLLGFFYLFYVHLLIHGVSRPAAAVLLHAAGGVAYFLGLGVLAAVAAHRFIAWAGLGPRGSLLHRMLVLPFLVAFPLFTVIPGYLHARSPEALTRVGEVAGEALFFLQLPVALWAAAIRGEGWMVALWGAVAVAVAGGALHWLWRFSDRSLLVGPLDFGGPPTSDHRSVFARAQHRAIRMGLLTFFWKKDIELPVRREPMRYLQEQAPLLLWVVVTCVLLNSASASGALGYTVILAGTSALAPLASACLAFLRTLPSLGAEGPQLARLLPILSPARILGFKLGPNLAYVLLHSLAYAILIRLATVALTGAAGIAELVLGATAGSLLFSALGTALGFLMPDPRRRGILLPGASLPAKLLFSGLVATLTCVFAAARFLVAGGGLSRGAFSGLLVGLVLFTLLLSGAITAWALRRLERNLY